MSENEMRKQFMIIYSLNICFQKIWSGNYFHMTLPHHAYLTPVHVFGHWQVQQHPLAQLVVWQQLGHTYPWWASAGKSLKYGWCKSREASCTSCGRWGYSLDCISCCSYLPRQEIVFAGWIIPRHAAMYSLSFAAGPSHGQFCLGSVTHCSVIMPQAVMQVTLDAMLNCS